MMKLDRKCSGCAEESEAFRGWRMIGSWTHVISSRAQSSSSTFRGHRLDSQRLDQRRKSLESELQYIFWILRPEYRIEQFQTHRTGVSLVFQHCEF